MSCKILPCQKGQQKTVQLTKKFGISQIGMTAHKKDNTEYWAEFLISDSEILINGWPFDSE